MGDIYSHYEENGNQDPRGLGGGQVDEFGHGESDVECPFCGDQVGAQLRHHLPCNGGED